MTRDDITRMAQEAGFVGFDGDTKCLREFANIVAAAEREAIAGMVDDCDPRATPKGIAAAIRARGQG
jgi:hypothetical protein